MSELDYRAHLRRLSFVLLCGILLLPAFLYIILGADCSSAESCGWATLIIGFFVIMLLPLVTIVGCVWFAKITWARFEALDMQGFIALGHTVMGMNALILLLLVGVTLMGQDGSIFHLKALLFLASLFAFVMLHRFLIGGSGGRNRTGWSSIRTNAYLAMCVMAPIAPLAFMVGSGSYTVGLIHAASGRGIPRMADPGNHELYLLTISTVAQAAFAAAAVMFFVGGGKADATATDDGTSTIPRRSGPTVPKRRGEQPTFGTRRS